MDGTGSIRADQVWSALTTLFGLKVEKADVIKMVQRYDRDSSGFIEFEEFVLMIENFNRKRYHQVFSGFDIDRSGKLDAEEVKNAFDSLGFSFSSERVNEMIKEYDDSGDGLIQFDEVMSRRIAKRRRHDGEKPSPLIIAVLWDAGGGAV